MTKDNYLTKKDLLVELHRSKCSYCYFIDNRYSAYHAIVPQLTDLTADLIAQIVVERARGRGRTPGVTIQPCDVVVRVMTDEHVPIDLERKRRARNSDRQIAKTNFPPFKHYIWQDGVPCEVGRSHWRGGFENGEFCISHGRMTNGLARMFMLLCDRIGRKFNYRGYSFLDEMQAFAIMSLMANGLMFDESKSDNPFSFYTTSVNHSFARVLNLEKRSRDIRDTLLTVHGVEPSFTRQLEDDLKEKFPALPPVVRKSAKRVSQVRIEED